MSSFIKDASSQILSIGRLLELESIPDEQKVIDAAESNMLVSFELPLGIRLRGEKSVVIEASVIGDEGNPQRIEMGEDVIVTGDVRFANLLGERVFVGGSVEHCQIIALKKVEVGADVSNCKIVVGEFRKLEQTLQSLKRQTKHGEEELAGLERTLRLEGKNVYRLFKKTNFSVGFRFGGIVKVESAQIDINLHSFYNIIGNKPEEELEHALSEFFRKGVLGVLLRNNADSLRKSTTQRLAFGRVIQALQNLFSLTLKLDMKKREIEKANLDFGTMLEELSSTESSVRVHGSILPSFDLTFVLPQVELVEDQLLVDRQTAEFSFRVSDEQGNTELVTLNTQGDESLEESGQLNSLEFRLHDNGIAWEPLKPD